VPTESIISYWLAGTHTVFPKIMLGFKHYLFWFCTNQPFKLAGSALNQGTDVLAGIYMDSGR